MGRKHRVQRHPIEWKRRKALSKSTGFDGKPDSGVIVATDVATAASDNTEDEQMQQAPNRFIDDVIGSIPVVGALWADAFHVWVGVTQAMNLAALRDETLAGPPPARAAIAALPAQMQSTRQGQKVLREAA
jgi:hypothetical protein